MDVGVGYPCRGWPRRGCWRGHEDGPECRDRRCRPCWYRDGRRCGTRRGAWSRRGNRAARRSRGIGGGGCGRRRRTLDRGGQGSRDHNGVSPRRRSRHGDRRGPGPRRLPSIAESALAKGSATRPETRPRRLQEMAQGPLETHSWEFRRARVFAQPPRLCRLFCRDRSGGDVSRPFASSGHERYQPDADKHCRG